MTPTLMKITQLIFLLFIPLLIHSQTNDDALINAGFKNTLLLHKEFVSMPNLPENKEFMLQNIQWVAFWQEQKNSLKPIRYQFQKATLFIFTPMVIRTNSEVKKARSSTEKTY